MPFPEGDDVPKEESIYDSPKMEPFDPESIDPVSVEAPPVVPQDNPSASEGDDLPVGDHGDPESPAEAQDEPQEPLPEFDPRVRDSFKGLLYLGALTSEFEWVGHVFKIRTLTTDEFLEIGLAVKKYEGSRAFDRAWQSAVVAACLISVDGKPLPLPVTHDDADTKFVNAFDYVRRKWFAPTISAVYARYIELEITVGRVVDAMGKATG